jgi:outer membrane murein-binding lipoprotein Lpp
MSYIKLSISFLTILLLFGACSQADQAQCGCLQQAQKVNRLSSKVWSLSATHNDSLMLKAALAKKDKLCKSLQESTPEALQKLKSACPQ